MVEFREHPMNMDDLGVPPLMETPMWSYPKMGRLDPLKIETHGDLGIPPGELHVSMNVDRITLQRIKLPHHGNIVGIQWGCVGNTVGPSGKLLGIERLYSGTQWEITGNRTTIYIYISHSHGI